MSDRDRISKLELLVAQLARQLSVVPVRLGDSAGVRDKFRLINGQSVGAQSGGTVLIDNVLELAGGLDPSGGNTATQISVYNRYSQSYADNEVIQAVYSEEATAGVDWEAFKTSGTEKYRLIRGLVKGDVTADDATFVIDNVLPMASGNDPVSGVSATEVTLQNIQKEAFEDNTPITAIYDGTNWEVLLVERYRAVRGEATGTVTSGTSSFSIDNLNILCSGLDPRSDTTSSVETLTVFNVHGDEYTNNDKVEADYNVETNQWECRKKGGSARLTKAIVYSAIAAATSSGSDIDPGTGIIKKYTRPATPGNNWVFVDSEVTAWNTYFDAFPVDTVVWVDDENYIVGAGCSPKS